MLGPLLVGDVADLHTTLCQPYIGAALRMVACLSYMWENHQAGDLIILAQASHRLKDCPHE